MLLEKVEGKMSTLQNIHFFVNFLLDDFIVRAFLGSMMLVMVSGPLGCFIVWRQMAFLSDTVAHIALLGIVLGLLFSLDLHFAVMVVCVTCIAGLSLFDTRRVGMSTLLGVLAHSALALGLIFFSLFSLRLDLYAYLFGDVLAISQYDLLFIFTGGSFVLLILFLIWRPLLMLTIDKDLAVVEGVHVGVFHFVFLLLLAFTVTLAMKVMGILLVSSLLLIPPATIHAFSRTPSHMIILAILCGFLAVIGGFVLSLSVDTPTGPSIVVVAFSLFLCSHIVRLLLQYR